MGVAQSMEEDKNFRYENLSQEQRKNLLNSTVRINRRAIKLERAKSVYNDVQKHIETELSPDVIRKILDGETVDLVWDLQKRRSQDTEGSYTFHKNCEKELGFCCLNIEKKTTYKDGSQCSSSLKGAMTFASLSKCKKQTVCNAVVNFQGARVKLSDLVYGDYKFYELLNSDDLAIMIKFKDVTFFNSTNIPETNAEEVCFTTRRNLFEEWKSGVDYDHSEYLKGDTKASTEAIDDVGGKSGKKCGHAQRSAWGGSGSVCGSSCHVLRRPSGGDGSGGGGKDGEEGDRSKFEWSSSQKMQEEEDSAPKDAVYELNEVLSVEKLVSEGMETKLILLDKSNGASETLTLFSVQHFIREHFKSLKIIPYIFYLNLKENAETIARKLSIIKTDSKSTILDRLKTLAFGGNENYEKARMALFEAKYRKGHMAFLWDNTEEVADKELLQEIFKEIYEDNEQMIELGCQKNVQWIVSSRTFVKEREEAFGCNSYCFVRLNNQKVLEDFGRALSAKEDNQKCEEMQKEIDRLAPEAKIKFQIPVKRKSFGPVSVNEDNHYNILKRLYTDLNLSNDSQKILTCMAVKRAIEQIKEGKDEKIGLTQLDVVQNMRELTKKEMRCGAFKFDKTLKKYTLLEHFLDFLVVDYLRDAIYFDTNALTRQRDDDEIMLRLTFLIHVTVKLPSIRLTLRDFLLTEPDAKLHKSIRQKISDRCESFLSDFNLIPSAAQLSILHCLACDEELYEYFGSHAPNCKHDMDAFLKNERKKIT